MPNDGDAGSPGGFDLARIKQLARLMRENDLTEIALEQDGSRVRLRRGHGGGHGPHHAAAVVTAAPAKAGEAAQAVEAKPVEASRLIDIKSPIVGTFYSASSPDVEPFVKPGTAVTPESTVCIVEAMKVFNEIPSGVSGVVREILVENGAPVDYGQPLFRVDPN